MHTLGKVLSGFVMIMAFVAVFFTTKVLAIRTSWMSNVEAKAAAYEASVPKVELARQQLLEAESRFKQVLHGWAPLLGANVQVAPNPGTPGQIILGMSVGLRQPDGNLPAQVVHVFSPTGAAGESIYVGPFRVVQVGNGQSSAEAAWPLRDSDKANWPQPFQLGQCRVYGSTPSSGPENVLAYSQLMIKRDELLAATTQLRDVRNQEVQVANEHLEYRNNELHGDPALEGDKGLLPDYLIDGLVSAIEAADETRNMTATEVDKLRHRLKLAHDEVQELTKKNRELVKSLPQPDPNEYDEDSTTAGQPTSN